MNVHKIFIAVLIGISIISTSCIGAPKKTTTRANPSTLLDRVTILEGGYATLNNEISSLVSGNSTYSFTLQNNVIQVQLPSGSDSIQLSIHVVPQSPLKLKETDYDNAFKEACSGEFVNIAYIPQLQWDGTSYNILEMLCHSTRYTLTNDVQQVKIPFTTKVSCNTYIGVLDSIK